MTPILENLQRRFGLDWTVLLVGWEGPGKYPRLIDVQDVKDYALSNSGDTHLSEEAIVELESVDEDDTAAICRMLRSLSTASGSRSIALRKWIVCLLDRTLGDLPDEPTHGLLALSDFWERFDYPKFCPHGVQGRDETRAPGDYYTETNFRATVEKHKRWLAQEIEALQGERP